MKYILKATQIFPVTQTSIRSAVSLNRTYILQTDYTHTLQTLCITHYEALEYHGIRSFSQYSYIRFETPINEYYGFVVANQHILG